MIKSNSSKIFRLAYAKTICITIFSLTLINGCGENRFSKLSNSELQDKYSFCEDTHGLSPGGAIICDNVRTECKRRAEAANTTVCY